MRLDDKIFVSRMTHIGYDAHGNDEYEVVRHGPFPAYVFYQSSLAMKGAGVIGVMDQLRAIVQPLPFDLVGEVDQIEWRSKTYTLTGALTRRSRGSTHHLTLELEAAGN